MSPLLLSSLEMMQHAIEHLKQDTEKDRGFAVLHADNSVEIILKELARCKGIRVIDKRGYSMDYYECLNQLIGAGVKIPELPSIDLLHTERNNIYHLGNKPDKNKAEWLVYDVALGFVRRMCMGELNYNINDFSREFILSKQIEQDIDLTRSEAVNQYLIKAKNSFDSGIFESTIMMAYIGIEALLREYASTKFMTTHEMMKTITEETIFSQIF